MSEFRLVTAVTELTAKGEVPVASVEINWSVVRIDPPETSSFCPGDAVPIPTLPLSKTDEVPKDAPSHFERYL